MFNRFYAWATALIAESKDENGQTFVEYSLVLVLVAVAVAVLAAWTNLDTAIGNALGKVVTSLNG